jgi:tetratricopeptide (TPR) repeat protein
VSPRPAIFISAVSKELRSARQLVSNTLTFLGYEPEWQDVFSTEEGDLRAMLRRRIDACEAVVQVVGHCYGAEPPAPDEQFGRVSYTQYEALYARHTRKKIWYLILEENFTADPHPPEPPELRELQSAYRSRLKSENLVYHPLATREALEASVLKLRDDLTGLRRGAKRWAMSVSFLLVLSVVLGVSILYGLYGTNKQLTAQKRELAEIRNSIVQFPGVQSKYRQEQTGENDPAAVQRHTYETLAKQRGIDARVLEQKLPRVAEQLKNDPNASAYERASAAYVAGQYKEAERLALVAADDAKKASRAADAIKAFELAGNSADARIEYARALQHYRDAAQLTDRTRDPLEWAQQQWKIAYVLQEQGEYAAAEAIYQNALVEYQLARGGEDPDVLALRTNLANALRGEGKYAEAEAQHREVIQLRDKLLGPEDPETLASRANLANALAAQGKAAEAEALLRQVIPLQEKILGPEHLDTLACRNNLGNALRNQGRFLEAETLYRSVLEARERLLGPEHPSTLVSRHNIALTLSDQGRYAESETEYREVIRLRDKVIGPEHPFTLSSCFNLATCLKAETKLDEAKLFARRAANGVLKVLGANHPDTLRYQQLWQELQNESP